MINNIKTKLAQHSQCFDTAELRNRLILYDHQQIVQLLGDAHQYETVQFEDDKKKRLPLTFLELLMEAGSW